MKTNKKSSVKIGSFTPDQQGILQGRIFGLGLGSTSVSFVPQTSQSGNNYYRLMADSTGSAYEIGVAFPKEKNGNIYHSINIDSPVLPAPISAALFPDRNTGEYNLFWSRPEEKADFAATNQFGAGFPPAQTVKAPEQKLTL